MTPGVCSALATAEFRTLATVRDAPSGENWRIRRASMTCRPRTRSTTRRALRGEILTYLAVAFASITHFLLERRAPLGVVPVRAEHPGGSELAQLVPHHRLRDEHRHVLAAVVDGDGVPDHLGHDGRAAGPGAEDPLVPSLVHVLDLGHEVVVHERTLLHRSRHLGLLLYPRPLPRLRTMNLSEGLPFLRVRPSFLPHGLVGWRPPEDLPSPPPSGWSTGFMATPRTDGRLFSHRARPALPSATLRMGRAFPGRMSAPSPDIRRSPTATPFGARMYRFSPSA